MITNQKTPGETMSTNHFTFSRSLGESLGRIKKEGAKKGVSI
jgi:hypothetical protein